jgi:hypothetical protein
MQVSEIQSLTCKPDLKKAMLFVKQFGHQDRSVHTAELIADTLTVKHHVPTLPQGVIYVYDGPTTHVKIHTQGSMQHQWQVTHDVFLSVGDRVWLNHTWCTPTQDLWSYSRKLADGDLNTYNQILHTHVNQKHAASP